MEVKSNKSKLNGLTLFEKVDCEMLELLINSSLLRKQFRHPLCNELYDSERQQLIKYKKLFNKEKEMIETKYTRSINYGRVTPVKCLGLFTLRKEIRHTLAREFFVDIDIVNCHPNLLYQICLKQGIECKNLKNYVINRDKIILYVQKEYNVTYKIAKNLFIRILYLGGFKSWAEDNKINKDEKKFIKDLTFEMIDISKKFESQNSKLLKEIEKKRSNKNEEIDKPASTVLSYVLQQVECEILESIYDYCVENKYIENNICVLCADGIMIEKRLYNDNILKEFENVVKFKHNYDLKFVIKEMNEGYSKEELLKTQVEEVETIDEETTQKQVSILLAKQLKDKYIYTNEEKTYTWYYYNEDNRLIKNYGECSKLIVDVTERLDTLSNSNKEICKVRYIKDIVSLLKNYLKIEDFGNLVDSNEDILAFSDCVFDIKKLEFRKIEKHDYVLNYINKKMLNFESNNDDYLKLMNFINPLFISQRKPTKEQDNLRDYMLDLIARSIFDKNKKNNLYIWTGIGKNGKSSFINLIQKSFEYYAETADSTFLTSIAKESGKFNETLADCHHKRLLICSEPEKTGNENSEIKLNASFIKRITGGDEIKTRKIYKSEFKYMPIFTPIILCNNLPNIDVDGGVKRRIHVIPFKFKFEKNPKNEFEQVEQDLGDFFNENIFKEFISLIIRVYTDIRKNNKDIIEPIIIQEETKEFLSNNDTLKIFVDYYIKHDENGDIYKPAKPMKSVDVYKHYCEHTSNNVLKIGEFYKALKQHGINTRTLRGYNVIDVDIISPDVSNDINFNTN